MAMRCSPGLSGVGAAAASSRFDTPAPATIFRAILAGGACSTMVSRAALPSAGCALTITVARYEAETVVIASGLAKGDIVISAGVNTLREGQKVRLADAAPRESNMPMKTLNLSRWAIEHKSLVVYFMLVIALAGLLEYGSLGREEDPPFTIKTMVVKTLWPGATTLETVKQVTDRIEKKLEELPNLDYLKSYTKPGESVVFVNLKDSTRASDVPDLWYQVRKKVGDIKQTLPEGVQGPFFNDEFGDTYSLIFALTSDGFGKRELRDYAERIRAELLGVPDVAKIDLLGTQDEKIYLEFSNQQLTAMGLDISQLVQTLQAQNAIQPSGTLNARRREDRGPRLRPVRLRRESQGRQLSRKRPLLSAE